MKSGTVEIKEAERGMISPIPLSGYRIVTEHDIPPPERERRDNERSRMEEPLRFV